MILLDANILLYAYDAASERHEKARRWLEESLSGPGPVGLSWAVILAFLRISTNPGVLRQTFPIADAISLVSRWLAEPTVTILNPGEDHWGILSGLLESGQARGPLVTDAHLAALALEHGAVLCTTDRDFTRFPKLRTWNPLEGSG